MTILIIDDEVLMRQTIALILQANNWEVIQAGDGETGLLLARSRLPDLILCDFAMEGINGYQTLARLREQDATANIPFILLTGMVERVNARHSMDLGADDYLAKPFDPDQLVRCVEARMTRARRNREQTAQKLAALRTSILAALPHEFKTPLNGILGCADLLLSDSDTSTREEQREMLQDIRTSARTLDRLVNRFLACAELSLQAAETATGQPAAVVSDPAAGLAVMARSVAGRHRRQGDLTLDFTAGRPAATDEHCTRLAEELLDNACKFSPRGSPIRFTGGERAGRYALEVADAGRGLTAGQIADAGTFLQFDRRRLEQPGAGLGLATVRLLAEMNGGEFNLQSALGCGTTATVTLPLIPPESCPTPDQPPNRKPDDWPPSTISRSSTPLPSPGPTISQASPLPSPWPPSRC